MEETVPFGKEVVHKYFKFKVVLNSHFNAKKDLNQPFFFRMKDYNGLVNEFKSFSVEPINKDASIVEIKLKGANVSKIVDFLNLLTDEYISRGLEQKTRVSIRTVAFIDNELKGIADSLYVSERALQVFRSNKEIMNDCTSFYSTDSIPAACSSNYRTTSVSEHAGGYSFSVSPNPAISTITITVEYDFSDSPLTIFDSYGRAILKSRLNGLTATLDISNFPDGAYFIRLDQGGKGKMIFKYH